MFIRNALARRVGLALGVCALAALPASADNDNGYGYLRAVEGSATLVQAGSETQTPAELNQPVLVGDRLLVPARSRVEIVLADRNLLRIDGGSEVVLERLAGSPDSQDRGTVWRLIEGNLQLVVLRESLGDELPRIDTPNAAIYVQDYGVYRIAADQQTFTELVVRDGRAEVATDRRSKTVQAQEQAFIEGDSRIDVDSAGSYDNLERWARRLDEEGKVDSQYAEYLGDDLSYAGASLARNGSWIDYQGTRYWRPRVAADWRPYWNGRWAYTPSGNTWVSYDPWGWVPHHYGSWDYLPAYGWAWLPGYRWAPAWVYWYQGPSYTGWCPTGYYTNYYGSHWGYGFGFHFGVYGWAGGDWGLFNHWTFVSHDYWHGYHGGHHGGGHHDGGHHGGGHHDGGHFDGGHHDDWHDQRNVQRYAVSIDQMRGRGALERGLITTDSRPLTPEVLQDPRRAVAVLGQDPSARRSARAANGELPDVNDFIGRKPDLPSGLRRAIADGDANQLAGTPLRPDTLGRGGRDDRNGRETGRTADGARGARPGTPADHDPGQPRVVIGDGDDVHVGRRPAARSGGDNAGAAGAAGAAQDGARSPRTGRPAPGDSGGAARPERAEPRDGAEGRSEPRGGFRRPSPGESGANPGAGGRAVPRDNRDNEDRGGAVSDGRGRSGEGIRPAPGDAGGAPRPDRGVRAMPRDRNDDSTGRDNGGGSGTTPRIGRDRPQAYRRIEPGSERPADDPSGSGSSRGRSGSGYSRPESSGSQGSEQRPSARPSYERPEPRSSRPEARTYEPRTYDRPESRPETRSAAPRGYERPAPQSSTRGGSERQSSPRVYERPSSPRTSERPSPPSSAPPSSGRGGYSSSPSRPEPRVEPRGESRSSGRSEGRSSGSGHGSSSEGRSSSGGRSSGRSSSRDHGRN